LGLRFCQGKAAPAKPGAALVDSLGCRFSQFSWSISSREGALGQSSSQIVEEAFFSGHRLSPPTKSGLVSPTRLHNRRHLCTIEGPGVSPKRPTFVCQAAICHGIPGRDYSGACPITVACHLGEVAYDHRAARTGKPLLRGAERTGSRAFSEDFTQIRRPALGDLARGLSSS
jgi:hypothetical protein